MLEAGWIKPGRRRETPGRPVTWMTSTNFLDEFGISELKDLPGFRNLKHPVCWIFVPAIETIPGGQICSPDKMVQWKVQRKAKTLPKIMNMSETSIRSVKPKTRLTIKTITNNKKRVHNHVHRPWQILLFWFRYSCSLVRKTSSPDERCRRRIKAFKRGMKDEAQPKKTPKTNQKNDA